MPETARTKVENQMTERGLKFTLHGFWGVRPEPLELTAQRVADSFAVLAQADPALATWADHNGNPVGAGDAERIVQDLSDGVMTDSAGTPLPDAGYTSHFYLGDWSRPRSEKVDLGKFDVYTGGDHAVERSLVAGVVVTFDGEALATAARGSAEQLVREFARIWQPEFMAFTDSELLSLRPKYLRYPSWAYVAWLSDSISRDLDTVDGATTSRFGSGTIVSSSSKDASSTASLWETLVASQRIRAAEPKQAQQPQFNQ